MINNELWLFKIEDKIDDEDAPLFHTEPKQTTAIGDVTFNATFGWHAYTLYGGRVWDLTMKLAGSYVTGMDEQQYLRQAMGREVPNNLKKRMPRVDLR